MSDPVPPSAPSPAPAEPAAAAPALPKKPGLMRWKLLIGVILFVVVVIALVPLVLDPWVRAKLVAALAERGMTLSPDSKLSISLLGGRVHGENLKLLDSKDPTKVVATASALTGDLAIRDSLAATDIILNDLTIDGMSGSLRRRSDGTPPMSPPPEPGTDASKIDWAKWYQKAMDQYKQYADKKKTEQEEQQKKKDDEAKKPPDQRSPVPPHDSIPDPNWPQATKYQPLSRDGRKYPRLLIRHLSISGTSLDMPDASPFDVLGFKLVGENVAIDQDGGEQMSLDGQVDTKGAGPVTLKLDRTADGGGLGHLSLSAAKVPLAVLNDPNIAGADYAKYGASGDAMVTLSEAWTGWDLKGSLENVITGLHLKPESDAGAQAQQISTYVNQLNGAPLKWPVQLGGTLFAPTITDSGVKDVLSGSALDAAKGIATQKATEEATKLLDSQGQKNPQVKQVGDAMKNLWPPKKAPEESPPKKAPEESPPKK